MIVMEKVLILFRVPKFAPLNLIFRVDLQKESEWWFLRYLLKQLPLTASIRTVFANLNKIGTVDFVLPSVLKTTKPTT